MTCPSLSLPVCVCVQVRVGAGGAIVALSEVGNEYEEMLLKAKALRETLSQCVSTPVGANASKRPPSE